MDDINFEIAYKKLIENEGGYTDGKNQVCDMPTNMGITQRTLTRFANLHPDMPRNVKDLTPQQARHIYKIQYWDNTKIPMINNTRIRNAIFDMHVMGAIGAGKTVQRAVNQFLGTSLVADGIIGNKTVNALNTIAESSVCEFMQVLKNKRIENLMRMKNWPTAKNGWMSRTNKY